MRNDSFSVRFYPYPQKKTERGEIPIYARITINRKKVELSTRCSILRLDMWDDLTQRERNSRSTINPLLSQLESKLNDLRLTLQNSGKHVTSQLLKEHFLTGGQKQIKLFDYVQQFFDQNVQSGNPYSIATIKNFSGTIKHFKNFLISSKNEKVLISNTDEKLILDFHAFLSKTITGHSKLLLKSSTIMKHHKRMKSVFRNACNQELMSRNPYYRFKITDVKGTRPFLTRDELTRLEVTPLAGNLSLENVRNIFLFSVYSGLRFTDAQNLRTSNLEFDGNKYWLRFMQQKTGSDHRVPLLLKALAILQHYSDLNMVTGYLLPQISNQKLNSYLKVIAEICLVKKKISHHVARHTHATTIMLANGASIEVVSRQLGHTDIRTTQIYAKITNQMLAETVDMIETKLG